MLQLVSFVLYRLTFVRTEYGHSQSAEVLIPVIRWTDGRAIRWNLPIYFRHTISTHKTKFDEKYFSH